MITISLLAYECTAEEARSLPRGFQFLEYDSLYESFRLMTAGKERVRNENRYSYLCLKEPLAGFIGTKGRKSKLCAAQTQEG